MDSQSTCPNDAKDKFNMREFARIVRKGYRKPKAVTPMCTPVSSEDKGGSATFTDPNR